MYHEPLNLNGPQTLVIQAQSVAVILDVLSQLPFRQAEPVLRELYVQLRASNGAKDGEQLGPLATD